jgi:phage tail sheath protein FI
MEDDDATTLANHLIAIAEYRKDCVAFISPPLATTNMIPAAGTAAVGAVGDPNYDAGTPATGKLIGLKSWRDGLTSSSYAFGDSSALYVYDKYKDRYRWIPASGAMAGLSANADMVADAWFSPAGMTRGNLRNVTKLAFNPAQAERDDLYKVGLNPLVSFPGQGVMLWGDKTLQVKASAFDRINVRRLFITLEKAISQASKASLFEFNDEFTRAQFRNMVEPFLRDIKGRRGVTDFKVVCDETNNTGNVIDTNRFVADIYIKPARSINFITLNFVATRTGVEFSEIAGGN